ncbi:MAG: ATP-binding protein [Clostridium sp.]|nr:ATP-binding protein [Clostridium sp.]
MSGGFVYVDKTRLIYDLVSNGTIYFLSRPRRFGKSLLVSTLKYYFLGDRELFRGLAIDSLETEWAEHPVFHIDFNGENFTQPGVLENKIENAIATWEDEYGHDPHGKNFGDRFLYVLSQAHKTTGKRCVVLIDEYDKPLLDVLDTGLVDNTVHATADGKPRLIEDTHRDILKGFYSVFKAADQDLQFVLLTGVTKFSQVSVFRGFNQPRDISMDSRYEALCGITEEELHTVFAGRIEEMAVKFRCSANEMRARLKKRYDGYHFSEEMLDIYNPFSVLNALDAKKIEDYWFKTGTPSYLIRLLTHTGENLNELTGKYYRAEEFIDYKADIELPLPMIYQSGYLTVKKYKPNVNTYLLDFPNNEVKNGFVTLVAANYFKNGKRVGGWVIEVIDAMEEGDTDTLRNLFTTFLSSVPYTMRRKDSEPERERYFHYTIYLIMRMISCYAVYTEKQNSKGRADCIVETAADVYIFEFKLDGTAQEALRQIEEKGYAQPYATESRTVHCIGVSFSSETGTIEEWEEKEM